MSKYPNPPRADSWADCYKVCPVIGAPRDFDNWRLKYMGRADPCAEHGHSGRGRLDGLKAAREAAGVSVNVLARAARISTATVVRLEGKPRGGVVSAKEANQIAGALNTDLASLGWAEL